MKRLLLIFLTMLWMASLGHDSYLEIEGISEGEDFYFPIIHSADKLVEEKINVLLQIGELDLIKGKEVNNIFEIVSFDNQTVYGGKVSIYFHVLANTDRVLSIKFNQSSCGVTCAYWVSYYNFNPQNGDKYALIDFFSSNNYKLFRDIITPIRQDKLKIQIEQLIYSGDNLEHLEDYIYTSIENDKLEDFYFTADSIYFDNENLLYKLDKLWDIDHIAGVSIESIAYLINDIGRSALITGNDLKSFRSMADPQLYEGFLDESFPLFIIFNHHYSDVYIGQYAFKDEGRAIWLDGNLNGDTYVFIEKDDNYNEVSRLIFTKDDMILSGYLQYLNGNKFSFEANRK